MDGNDPTGRSRVLSSRVFQEYSTWMVQFSWTRVEFNYVGFYVGCLPRVQQPPGGIPEVDSKGFDSLRGVPTVKVQRRLKCDWVVSNYPG